MAETEVSTAQDHRLSETEALVKRQIERVETMLEEQMAKTAALVEKQLERARSFLQQNREKLQEKNRDCNEQTKLQTPTKVITDVYTNTPKSTQNSTHGHTSTGDVTKPCSIKREPLKGETVLTDPYPQNTFTGTISPLQTCEMRQLTSNSEKGTSNSNSLEWVCRQCNATNQLQLTAMHETNKQDYSRKNVTEIDNQRQSAPNNVISRSQISVREEDILSSCNKIFSPPDIAEYSFKEDTIENSIDQANRSSIRQGNVTDKKMKSQERDIIAEQENSQPCNISSLTGQNNHYGIHQTNISRENNYSEQESQIVSLKDLKDFISKSTQTILSFEIIMSEDTHLRNQSDPISENTVVQEKVRTYTHFSTSDEDTLKSSIKYDLHSTDTPGTNSSPDPKRNKINLMPEPNQPKSISDDDTLHSTCALRLEDSSDGIENKTNNSSQTTVIFNRPLSDSNGFISVHESEIVSVESIANDCNTRNLSVSLPHDETCSSVDGDFAVVEADEEKEICVIDFLRNQQKKPDTTKCIKEDVNTLSYHTFTESVSTSTLVNQTSLEMVINQTDETVEVVDNKIADDSNNAHPHDYKESPTNIKQLAEYQQLNTKLTTQNEESSLTTSMSDRSIIPPYDTIDKVVFSEGSLDISPTNIKQLAEYQQLNTKLTTQNEESSLKTSMSDRSIIPPYDTIDKVVFTEGSLDINVLERTEILSTVEEEILYPNEGATTLSEVFLGYVDPSGIQSGEQIHNQNFEVRIIAESVQRMHGDNYSESSHLEGSVKDRIDCAEEEVFAAATRERCGDKSTIRDQCNQITNTEEHLDTGIFKGEIKHKTTPLLLDDSHPNTTTMRNKSRDINDDLNDKYVSNIKNKPSKSSNSEELDHPATNDKQAIHEIFEAEIISEEASLLYDDNTPRGTKTQTSVDKRDGVQNQNPTQQRRGDKTLRATKNNQWDKIITKQEIHDNTDKEDSDIVYQVAPETATLLQGVPMNDLGCSANSLKDKEHRKETKDNQADNAKKIIEGSDSVVNVPSKSSTFDEHTNQLVFESKIIPENVPLLYIDDKNAKGLAKDISEVDNIDKKLSLCTVEEDILVPESAPLLYSDPTCSNKPNEDDADTKTLAALKSHTLTPTDNNQDSSENSSSSLTPESSSSDVMYELLENNSKNARNDSHEAKIRKSVSLHADCISYASLKDSDDEHSETGALSNNDRNQNPKHRNDIHVTNLETKTVKEFTKTKPNVDLPLLRTPSGESTKITDKVKYRPTINSKLGTRTSEKTNGNLVIRHNLTETLRNTDLDNSYQHSLHSEKSDESCPRALNIQLSENQNRPLSTALYQVPVKEDTHELSDESSTEEELDSSFFERERERYVYITSSASSSLVFEETDVSSYHRTTGSDQTESRSPNPCETKPETASTERMLFEPKSDKETCSFYESDISIGREDLSSSILQFSSINQDTVDGSTEDIVIDERFSRITRTGETSNNSSEKHPSTRSRDKSKGKISSRKTKSSMKDNAKCEYVRKSDLGVTSSDTDPAVQLGVTVRPTNPIAGTAFISQSNMGSQLGPHQVNDRHKSGDFESSSFDSSNLSIRSEAHDITDGSEDWTTTDDIESNILQGTSDDSTDVEDTFLKERLTFVDSSERTDTLATSSETITQIANPGYKRN
ncbi:hypothetical protein SNE40_020152 [Patella caerulea]|uniref:Uncharacterized protein n=1 Tax=Patella caerulea TaxID=87958 RepID=A0AAN8IZD7_PATCE